MSEDFEPEVPENDDIVGVAVKGSLALFLVVVVVFLCLFVCMSLRLFVFVVAYM